MQKKLLFAAILFSPLYSFAQVSVLTQHNDLARTGANLHETELSVSTVNANDFGKIFTRLVDDQIYTQPLVVSGVDLPSIGKRNVVYVATVNNTVYAFDADDPMLADAYWYKNYTPSGAAVVKNADMTGACGGNYKDFSGNMGIVGTPVIDTLLQTMFFVSRDKLNSGGFEQWLHAVNITNGNEQPNSPKKIVAKFPGNGDGSVNDTISFDAQKHNQRPALALVNGIVYIAWASHCDWGPYHGWVIGYDAATLVQKYVWMDTPTGGNGGIWMSGQAISADADGNLYLSTGNGTVGENGNPADITNRGESFIKLKPQGNTLEVASFFTPKNYATLEQYDIDLGSQGLLLVPGTNWAFGGGKEGKMYLVKRDTMGGVDLTTNHVIQEFSVGTNYELHGGAVYWHSDASDYVYIWPAKQYLLAYHINYTSGKLDLPQAMQSQVSASNGQPGGMLAISADGSMAGTGILWALLPLSGDANHETRPGVLRAYDASDLSHELWNSQMNLASDSIGGFAKFVCPTVANGKVYVSTFSGKLNVYGLLNTIGIQDLQENDFRLSVYPNPVREQLILTGDVANVQTVALLITGITGKIWKQQSASVVNNRLYASLDVSMLPAGAYFIHVNGSVKLFIKQ